MSKRESFDDVKKIIFVKATIEIKYFSKFSIFSNMNISDISGSHHQLPYQIKIYISEIELSRNVQDDSLPIDAVNIRIMGGMIELKSRAVKEREFLEKEELRMSQIQRRDQENFSLKSSSIEQEILSLSSDSVDEEHQIELSTSQRSSIEPTSSNRGSTNSQKSQRRTSLSLTEKASTSDEASDKKRTSTQSNLIKVVSMMLSTESHENSSRDPSMLKKKNSKAGSGILLNKSSVLMHERKILNFGSIGFYMNATQEMLANKLERKSFRYELMKNGEIIGNVEKGGMHFPHR